ncbi:uncharacterized protein LOC134535429 [Bacillus rossius redtenbacheri]|uniref:uncharacterized protein LOC134535429 n=1 Tax=Bacillus rossius redtenbacheri TaxID=93214 RepID=UPI002FDCA876
MSTRYSCRYEVEFPWATEDPKDKGSAKCKICAKSFKFDTMGRGAFLSHAKSKFHQNAKSCQDRNMYVTAFFSTHPGQHHEAVPSCSKGIAARHEQANHVDPDQKSSVDNLVSTIDTSETPNRNVLQRFLLGEHITRAEILWALHTIVGHTSLRKAAESVSVMKLMFPDCAVTQKMELQRSKIGYLINHGIAPYFEKELKELVKKSSEIVIGFDESLNKVVQREQMDIHVRFWDEELNMVQSRYFTSVFLSSTRAQDLLKGLKNVLGHENLRKIIQVSMDGPSVNWKLSKDLVTELREEIGREGFDLINIGSCGLHVVHGGFKEGIKVTGWCVVGFLRALYYHFKDVPLRRADFSSCTGCTVFPLKFCCVRWVENKKVAERAYELLPHMKTYVEAIEKQIKDKVKPKDSHFKRSFPALKESQNFKIICSAVKDEMMGAKLAFFTAGASLVEPFLREFQSDDPMAPFLHQELQALTTTVLKRVVRKEVIESAQSITNIDLSKNENLLLANQVDIGFAATDALKKVRGQLAEKVVLQFKNDCRSFYVGFLQKVLQRSPLAYSLTRQISCINPELIRSKPNLAEKRIKACLELLVEKQQIPGSTADKILQEYQEFIQIASVGEAMKSYHRQNQRLDLFYVQVMVESGKSFPSLLLFIKHLLILSHGNAALERGFSVNSDCLVENQTEDSLIAQRIVYDAVMNSKGVQHVQITKSLIHYARNSCARYKEHLESKRKKVEAEKSERDKKREAQKNLRELEAKKAKIMNDALKEAALIDEEIKKL